MQNIIFFLFLFACFACFACNPKSDKGLIKDNENPINPFEQARLEKIISENLEKRDENGNVEDLIGFEKSEKIEEETDLKLSKKFQKMFVNEEPIFIFTPPEGIFAEFSEPIFSNSTFLSLTDIREEVDSCGAHVYQEKEPTLKDLIINAKREDVCGALDIRFCIRLSFVNSNNSDLDKYSYAETPGTKLVLPCPDNSFSDIELEIADGQSHSQNSNESIKVKSFSSVIEIYLTSDPLCIEGGKWQYLDEETLKWDINYNEGVGVVYAKFKDIFGNESECIRDTISYGPSAKQCFADETNFIAENIKAGVSIGGLKGSGSMIYPLCTSDGQKNCLTTDAFPATSATDIDTKIIMDQAAAGVLGIAIPEHHVDCSDSNQENCVATRTYPSMDLSSRGAGGAVNLNVDLFLTRVKSSASFEYWDEKGNRHTSVGDEDIIEENIVNNAEIFGITGTAGASSDCGLIGTSGTWILVPGDPDYGTRDFCVMKYEAKNNANVPASEAAGSPWINITQQDAVTECASLGKGYHLITNDEWMTIAANISSVDSNWSGATVGTGSLFRGHTDDSPNSSQGSPCAASSDDSLVYLENNCTPIAAGAAENDEATQRRTHTLSNGRIIWDLAGNVWEWVSYFNDKEKPTPLGSSWSEFTAVTGTLTMPLSDLIPTNGVKAYWDDTWNSTQSIGQYYPGSDDSGGGLHRGSSWADNVNSGLFGARLSRVPTAALSDLGFRCVVSIP